MNPQEITEFKKAVDVLRKGGWIRFRGDVEEYVCCDISNMNALERCKDEKQLTKGVIVTDLESRLNYYLNEFPEQASVLFEYTELPLTIYMDGIKNLPQFLIHDHKAAFRITKDELTAKLSESIRRPLFCLPADPSILETDHSLSFFTSSHSKKDEKIMELTKGGVIRILSH